MSKYLHLSLGMRSKIEVMLTKKISFNRIAQTLGKDSTTISKEIKKNIITEQKGGYGRSFNDCIKDFVKFISEHSDSITCEGDSVKVTYSGFGNVSSAPVCYAAKRDIYTCKADYGIFSDKVHIYLKIFFKFRKSKSHSKLEYKQRSLDVELTFSIHQVYFHYFNQRMKNSKMNRKTRLIISLVRQLNSRFIVIIHFVFIIESIILNFYNYYPFKIAPAVNVFST